MDVLPAFQSLRLLDMKMRWYVGWYLPSVLLANKVKFDGVFQLLIDKLFGYEHASCANPNYALL